jgi:C4-dicarboxylate transporter, DctM subunit
MEVLFGSLIILFLMGVPVAISMGVATLLTLLLVQNIPLTVLAQRWVTALDNWVLMAVPFFLLAGALMDTGGLGIRIVNFAAAFLGWLRGSLLHVTVVASMVFADISGSSSADTAAVGSVMLPQMKRRNYNLDFGAAINAAAGAIGPIIPPSITMVVIAYVTNTSIAAMFAGGFVPGFMVGLSLMVVSYIHARSGGPTYAETQRVDMRQGCRAAFVALPALGAPLVIVGGILAGIFTATEAAAVAVFYGLFVGLFIYRELKPEMLPKILLRSAMQSAMVMFIAANAYLFAWLVGAMQIPQVITGWVVSVSDNPIVFLMVVNVTLLAIGMLMETFSAIIILMPILFPVAMNFGLDPVHFGVMVTVNLCVGMVTPPYGITLYVASTIAGRSVAQVSRHLLLPLSAMIIVLLMITYIPETVLVVPRALGLIR